MLFSNPGCFGNVFPLLITIRSISCDETT